MEISVNYLAVLVAALAGMVIGALWYSPVLFGKKWMTLMGLSEESMAEAKKKGMGKTYTLAFLCQLVMAFVLAHLIQIMNVRDVMNAIELGLWLWVGFIVTVMMNKVLWEGKKWALYVLDISHYLVVILAMAAILAMWQ